MAHSMSTQDPIPTRQSLLQRLKDWEDTASWQDFFDTYWRLIYGVARRAGVTDTEAQDVVQEVIIAVAKSIPEFNYDPSVGSFKSWLLRLTRWRIADQFRKKQYEKGGEHFQREEPLGTSLLERQPDIRGFDFDAVWDEEWRSNLFEVALEKVKRQVSPKQFQLFLLHVVNNLPARLVANRLRVKLTEVYFAKYKISASVKKEIKLIEKKMQ